MHLLNLVIQLIDQPIDCCIDRLMLLGANLLDQLLKLIDTVHLSDDDWTRVLRVMPNKLLKNHPFRPRSPLRTQLSGVDRQGTIFSTSKHS